MSRWPLVLLVPLLAVPFALGWSSREPAAPRIARVDLRSILGHAPFRPDSLERQREILERYRTAIDLCRREMDAIFEEWGRLGEHDDIPPQLEDRTEEILTRWTKARNGLLEDGRRFAEEEGKPMRERLRVTLEDAARRGGYEAVVQMPRQGGGATWGTIGADEPDFGGIQAVVWCRDCPDLTDELASEVGLPAECWDEDSAFRRAAVEFMREYESYAAPLPWEFAGGGGDDDDDEGEMRR